MNNNYSVDIAKKKIQKAIINEFYKKGLIDFFQYNSIVEKFDEDITKFESKLMKKEKMSNMIVKIPV